MIRLAYPDIQPKDVQRVLDVLGTPQISAGKYTRALEESFAGALGARHAIAVSSGTAALLLILRRLWNVWGLPVLEVLVPAYTFVASANAPRFLGAKVTLADVDEHGLLPAKAIEAWGLRGPVMPVHLFGGVVPVLAQPDFIVEDACQALGSVYTGPGEKRELVGSRNDAAFGFFANKQLAGGEGGIITTCSDESAAWYRSMRDQGRESMHDRRTFDKIGLNLRMHELAAALIYSQLGRLLEVLDHRAGLAIEYRNQLRLRQLSIQVVPARGVRSWFCMPVLLPPKADRNLVIRRLADAEIEAAAGYRAIHEQPAHHDLGAPGAFPVAEELSARVLWLPLHMRLSAHDVRTVVEHLARALKEVTP